MKKKLHILIVIISLFLCGTYQLLTADNIYYDYIKNLNYSQSPNLTKKYLGTNSESFSHFLPQLKDYKIIFLTGYLSKEILVLYDYFDEQMKLFSSLGIEVDRLKITSAKGIVVNAEIIINSLKKVTKKVIIISHSKGGLDFLEAYVQSKKKNDSSWVKNIVGWIAIQSPFYGSPVADDIKLLKPMFNLVLNILGGEEQSLEDLRIKERMVYMNTIQKEVVELVGRIPTITVATYVKKYDFKKIFSNPFIPNTLLSPFRDYYAARGLLIDGMVPYQSAILPKTDYVLFDNVDHLSPVSKNMYNPFDRIEFIKKMIVLLFDKKKTFLTKINHIQN